jgi:hypothetical protein
MAPPAEFIATERVEMAQVRQVKTSNRSVVGVMNEFVFLAQAYTGSDAQPDLPTSMRRTLAAQRFAEPRLQTTFGHYRAVVLPRDTQLAAVEADLAAWTRREPYASPVRSEDAAVNSGHGCGRERHGHSSTELIAERPSG